MKWLYLVLFVLLAGFAALNGLDGFGCVALEPFLFQSWFPQAPAWVAELYLIPLLLSYFFAYRYTLIFGHRGLIEGLVRVALSIDYLYSALHKAGNPYEFAQLIKMYQFLPNPFVDLFALIAPWFWILVAVALWIGPRIRIAAILYSLIMLSFMIALGQAAVRGLPITCGCFELEGVEPSTSVALLRDIVFVLPALWLIYSGRQLWFWELFCKKSK